MDSVITNDIGFTPDLPKGKSSIIKVVGVGGGGNNALKHMYERGIYGVDFVICNTDQQALDNNPIANKVQLGAYTTEGLGAGADPEVGEKAAIESIEEIKTALGNNTKMVFITAGMGGGTGTGAAPVVAKIAKEMGILTVAIVTIPFEREGIRRLSQAKDGLEKLKENVDSLIVINNDKLREQFGNMGFRQAFSKANEVLTNAAKGMAEVITAPFDLNIDFRDAKTVLENSGTALMSMGVATGEKRAEEAIRKALDSPLLNNNKITGAKNVLLLILSGSDEAYEATMDEVGFIQDYIQEEAGGGNKANIIMGLGVDEELGESIKVLVIATGFSEEKKETIILEEPIIEEPVAELPKEEPKIIYTLGGVDNDEPLSQSFSEINTTKLDATPTPRNVVATSPNIERPAERQVFRLEDTDEVNPNTPTNAYQMAQPIIEEPETMVLEEEEKPQKFDFFQEEETPSAFSFTDTVEEPKEEPNLFSTFDGENTVSFTFDLSDQVEKNNEEPIFQVEEPEIQFEVREETPIVETKTEEISFGIKEVEEIETPVFEPKVVETPTPKEEPKQETSFEVEQKEEFTIIERKAEDNPKVMERRNKLKEFNSRYYTIDNTDTFEKIPAFRRKNIDLNLENASEQRITNFISEENGQTKLRENRFLNKDVD